MLIILHFDYFIVNEYTFKVKLISNEDCKPAGIFVQNRHGIFIDSENCISTVLLKHMLYINLENREQSSR